MHPSQGHPAQTPIVLARHVIAQQSLPAETHLKMKIATALLHAVAVVLANAKKGRPLAKVVFLLKNLFWIYENELYFQ